jgi:hypothetical protein
MNISHGFPFCIMVIRSCLLPAPINPDWWGTRQMSGVGGCLAHAVRMNNAATAATALQYARQLFAFIVGPFGTEGTDANGLAAALPADTLTKYRTCIASFNFGFTLTVRPDGGKSSVPRSNLSCKFSLNRMCGLAEILDGH